MRRLNRKLRDAWSRLKSLNHLEETTIFEMRRTEMERSLLESTRSGITEEQFCESPVIVSLTSYGRRIEQAHLAIESLLRQTCRPNRIILWLADEEQHRPLPAALKLQIQRGLEVRYTQDIRSYKKLIPALTEFPDSIIITTDDDMIYDPCMIDRLVRGHIRFSGCVVTNIALKMTDEPMRTWALDDTYDFPMTELLPIGCGGILYPPHALSPEATDAAKFMELCPTADDIWFRIMGIKNGTKVVRTMTPSSCGWKDATTNPEAQKGALWHENVINDRNSTQYEKARNYFKL